jgi:hypothetical protein
MNVTPLIDVVLVLLIIFMVITPLMAKNFWVHLPKQEKAEVEDEPPPDAEPPLVMKLGPGRTISVNDTPIDERSHVWRWCVNCRADHMSRGDPGTSAARRIAGMFPAVVDQDRWALEKQQEMFEYPDQGYTELFLKPDKALRRARQVLMQMQHEERQLARGKAAVAAAPMAEVAQA